MGDEKISGSQKLFTGLVSPATAARMEAESRQWMVQCPECGYERSVWEMGGVRYKATGTSRQRMRCPQCGKTSWHKVYRQADAQGDTPATTATTATIATRAPRWLLWGALLGGLALVIVAFITILLFVIGLFTQPVASAGDDFMSALKTGDFAHAYALCSPDLQKELGSASALGTMAQGYQPARWNWTSRSVRNGVGRLDGSFTYTGGKSGTVHITLTSINNSWRITGFSLNPG